MHRIVNGLKKDSLGGYNRKMAALHLNENRAIGPLIKTLIDSGLLGLCLVDAENPPWLD